MPAPRARFPIRFDPAYRTLSVLLRLSPSDSFVDVDAGAVSVRMGWGFRARFSRTSIATVGPYPRRPLSRGIHGWAGRWLVNGSGEGIVSIGLQPPQRGYVMGFPVRLATLLVSVDEPDALVDALGGPASRR